MAPRKRHIDEITNLREPELSPAASAQFDEGIALFNAGHYWHAHEAWEHTWLTMPDDPSGDAEIILRGLIQLAAALHLVGEGRLDGAASNLRKASGKLALAPRHFMGLDFAPIIDYVTRLEARSLIAGIDTTGIDPLLLAQSRP